MRLDDKTQFAEFCVAYAARDLDRCATFIADDVVFALYVDKSLMPFGGVSIGKAAAVRRWEMIAAQFDLLAYRLATLVEQEGTLRTLVAYHFRHKATGEDIAGHMRHVITMRHGLIARADEHHDRARVEAFFRLIQSVPQGPE